MSTVLITGASGTIGRELAKAVAGSHDVLCMSRRDPGLGLPWVRGDFGVFEDLRGLDGHGIERVVHLGAVTGGCSERDGMRVNVEGTRCLMRYLVDRGCKKFVMTSSIAAVGLRHPPSRPQRLPIPDTHPCLESDGYGFSKHLMEEVTRYFHRQAPGIDVINLRLATIRHDDAMPPLVQPGPAPEWTLGRIALMAMSDAVRAFTLAAEAPRRPGVRTLNAASPEAWTAGPVAQVLRAWWGPDADLSWFERPGHAYDGVFDVGGIERELGFVARVLPPRGAGG